eukprot:scaffold70463_cov33-Prasinocladus_malaysianus.AAC.1
MKTRQLVASDTKPQQSSSMQSATASKPSQEEHAATPSQSHSRVSGLRASGVVRPRTKLAWSTLTRPESRAFTQGLF